MSLTGVARFLLDPHGRCPALLFVKLWHCVSPINAYYLLYSSTQQSHLKEVDMNNSKCLSEKIFSRTVGGILLTISFVIAIIGSFIIPIVGLIFAIPVLMGGLFFITSRGSKACRLVINNGY